MLPLSTHPVQQPVPPLIKPNTTTALPLPSFTLHAQPPPTRRVVFSLPAFTPPPSSALTALPAFTAARSTHTALAAPTVASPLTTAPTPLLPAFTPAAKPLALSFPAPPRTVSPQPLSPSPAAVTTLPPTNLTHRPPSASLTSSKPPTSSLEVSVSPVGSHRSALEVLLPAVAVTAPSSAHLPVRPSVVARILAHDTAHTNMATTVTAAGDGAASHMRLTPTLHTRTYLLYPLTQLTL